MAANRAKTGAEGCRASAVPSWLNAAAKTRSK
jgi:hypothetical protein